MRFACTAFHDCADKPLLVVVVGHIHGHAVEDSRRLGVQERVGVLLAHRLTEPIEQGQAAEHRD